jgi:hypothetical protein
MTHLECPCGLVIPLGPADRLTTCPACGHPLAVRPSGPARAVAIALPAPSARPVTLADVADWLAADRHRPRRRGRLWAVVVWPAAVIGLAVAIAGSGAAAWLITTLNR